VACIESSEFDYATPLVSYKVPRRRVGKGFRVRISSGTWSLPEPKWLGAQLAFGVTKMLFERLASYRDRSVRTGTISASHRIEA